MPRGTFAHTESMELRDGFKKFWTRALDYHGTTSRREFWWGVLGNALIMVALLALWIVSITCVKPPVNAFSILTTVAFAMFCIVELLPSITLIIRRMHDIGKSGFYIFVLFIPIFGFIWYLCLVTRAGVPNKYE